MATGTNDKTTTEVIPEIYLANKFWIESNGVLEAFFTECSGLEAKTEVFEYKEGGFNEYTHKLPVRTSYTNLTLKHGVAESRLFWDWYSSTIAGKIDRKNISIILYSGKEPGKIVRRWEVTGAYPIKWAGPQMAAKSNEFAIETIELVYEFFKLVKPANK